MPAFGPIKRKTLLYYLGRAGFSGPYSGGKHQFMLKGRLRVRIPNPHKADIGKNLRESERKLATRLGGKKETLRFRISD